MTTVELLIHGENLVITIDDVQHVPDRGDTIDQTDDSKLLVTSRCWMSDLKTVLVRCERLKAGTT